MKAKKQKTIKILLLGTLIFGMGGFLLSLKPVSAATGINKQINFQGKVVNTDGTNVSTASYNFLFCIYTTASPATPCTSGADNDAVWRESKSLTVTDGIFQTNLGDTTALPGSVDFNTDNIYLGVNFNSNGQMTPLVRFTAAPYAMNADKIHGLTVTDTTGTLTIASAKTLTASNTLTFQGTDGSTLNIGTGGTLGTAAYTASTAYLASGNSTQLGYFNDIYLDDSDASNHLILDYGSNVASDFTLSLLMTASRNLTIAGDASLSGTNTGDQSIFQTFAVSGQSNVVADSTTDTLTLIAGTNVTITTNATNDEITINSSGGSGPWTDGSGITYLTDTAEDFAVGGSVLDSPFSVDVSLAKLNLGASATFDPITITPVAKGTTSYSGNITSVDLTSANRTWTFPDADGTVAMTSDLHNAVTISDTSTVDLTLSTQLLSADVVANSIGDTQLAYDTGQTLTSTATPTFQTLALGYNTADGSLALYSEQGGTDYTATLLANTAMTSAASFYLPADEPAGTYLLNMTTGGVIGYDSSTYLTSYTETQNLFQTFAVSGQSNVVADSTTDTVTLIAGTNVTITTNATNDEITINATGG